MRWHKRLLKPFGRDPVEEPVGPPLPHPVTFFDRSFHIPGEGITTVIGYHQMSFGTHPKRLLRVQIVETSEVCLVSIPYLLSFGEEVEYQPVDDPIYEDGDDDRVERIICIRSVVPILITEGGDQ